MNKNTVTKIAGVFVLSALFFGFTTTTFAEEPVTDNLGAPVTKPLKDKASAKAAQFQAKSKALIEKSSKEIEKRLSSLNELSTRVGEMDHVSPETRASINSTIQSTTAELNDLKSKLGEATDTKEMQEHLKSIANKTRVYALVEPQSKILAAADRAGQLVDTLNILSAKFDARVTAAQAAGQDITTILAAQADFKAKLADAKTQIQTAVTAVTGLTPDEGDATKKQANETALKTARAALKAANTDIKAARADIKTIQTALKALKADTKKATGTTTE